MLLEIRIAHFASTALGLSLFCLTLGRIVEDCLFLHLLSCRSWTPVEPDIPSKLDISDYSSCTRGWTQDASELHNPLIIQRNGVLSRVCKSISRILQVFRVSIVERGDLSLCVAVFLLWISHVVRLRWKESSLWHAWSESPSQISSRELVPRIQGHFSLHARHFIPAIQDLEVLELSLIR